MASWVASTVECDYFNTIASHWVFSKTLKSPKNIQRKCKFMDDRNIFYTSLLCIFFRIKRTQHKSFYCCSSDCKLISLYQKANKVKMEGLTAASIPNTQSIKILSRLQSLYMNTYVKQYNKISNISNCISINESCRVINTNYHLAWFTTGT